MRYILFVFLALSLSYSNAQPLRSISKKGVSKEIKQDWHNLDYKQDKIYGTSANRVYSELIKDKKAKKKVVVAVIDSGVDWEHEDLSMHIWVNTDEIEGNGLDDDKNGYVDDVHGWNFLATKDGTDIEFENLEATRVLREGKALKREGKDLKPWMTDDFMQRATEIYNSNVSDLKGMEQLSEFYIKIDSILTEKTGNPEWSFEEAFEVPHDENPMESIHKALKRLKLFGIKKEDLKEISETAVKYEGYYLNYDFIAVEDRAADNANYGNNHYEGPDAVHGTHVAGIIAADRNNEIGARGVASDVVEIMTIRAVPDGDERDLDIANAIRYAVDNGANIINMSFGKGLSPQEALVNNALLYASENNVLVVHAAGNDSENNDIVANYPNPYIGNGAKAATFLTIGASAISRKKDVVASFSNYGKEEVDIFSPGHDVYSTVPNSEYKLLSGTSMAAPVASGVAALVWAYHPDLSAVELKQILLDSATFLEKKKVKKPGNKQKVRFGELSATGGIINAYNAFQMAATKG
jgi:subtilisin family serine protease